jgi:rhamnogalacturonyl hydrolase YesR
MQETSSNYIDEKESINYYLGENTKQIIEVIAKRYIGENPPLPFVFHAFNKAAFLCSQDGRFDLNLINKLPDAQLGQASYLATKLWKNESGDQGFSISCYGPVRVYVNGVMVFRSTVGEEVNIRNRKHFNASCNKGWNSVVVYCIKTSSGFGCQMGVADAGWAWVSFDEPFCERKGRKGFVFSETVPYEGDETIVIPDIIGLEKDTLMNWYPKTHWDKEKLVLSPLERLYGKELQAGAWCWSSFRTNGNHVKYEIRLEVCGSIELWIDGKAITMLQGNSRGFVLLDSGKHDILIKSLCLDQSRWFANVELWENNKKIDFDLPYPVQGTETKWLYLDTNAQNNSLPQDMTTMYQLFENGTQKNYWRLDEPDTVVRPYLENELFGKWNYPLGVTLYGLLQTGRMLELNEINNYVLAHIDQCISLYEYSLWDREVYGYPEINSHISSMRTLDDCGSFGSAMLESLSSNTNQYYEASAVRLADKIANYMENYQERQPDGAFYRELKGIFCENTLWADDLYMSIPFLCRYYKRTGKQSYINDAVKQFKLYKKYLYIPEQQVMSHVYDFKYDVATFMPWGRGNGWVFFSLSELLETLPKEHADRDEMLTFFNELCDGYIKLQGNNGLWHQLLTHPDAYEETSCTAMFIYGFARGVRHGWINLDVTSYVEAALKGWNGLTKKSIDKKGDVHGVCGGSAYSFTSEYYKKDLQTRLNDTHGIGIVLLAGIEVMRLKEYLRVKEGAT